MSVTLVVTAAASPDARDAGAALTLTFDQPRIVIGRGAHADVRLPSRAVSDTHALLRLEASDLSIVDDGSTNGTTVNDQPIVRGRRKALRNGDRIGVPGYELTVETSHASADPPGRTMTVARRLLASALATVGSESAPPELVLTTGRRAGQRWVLPKPGAQLSAGRGETCELVLDDPDCSRQHAQFERDELGVIVRDLGSKNGVFVGGRSAQERRLRHGDEVQLGRSVLAYSDPAEELLRTFETGPDEPPSVPPKPPPVPPRPATEQPTAPPAGPAPRVERNALTMPPPAPSTAEAAANPPAETPREGEAGGATAQLATAASNVPARRRNGHAADWIVVVLAMVILGVSAAALYVLLKGTPAPH